MYVIDGSSVISVDRMKIYKNSIVLHSSDKHPSNKIIMVVHGFENEKESERFRDFLLENDSVIDLNEIDSKINHDDLADYMSQKQNTSEKIRQHVPRGYQPDRSSSVTSKPPENVTVVQDSSETQNQIREKYREAIETKDKILDLTCRYLENNYIYDFENPSITLYEKTVKVNFTRGVDSGLEGRATLTKTISIDKLLEESNKNND